MSNRQKVTAGLGSHIVPLLSETHKVSEYFASHTFSEDRMKQRVPVKVFNAYKEWQSGGEQISMEYANTIAEAMKSWALDLGATSYTHWFQPMTGSTAEKHDSFISVNGEMQILERFNGSNLVMGEPDASSFPSGGLRSTFEARGYTAWDPSSPAFIREVARGKTLCIPSVFVSYHGEALDKKLPLLRSDRALDKAAKRILAFFGITPKKIYSTCGPEQEFFLIDEGYFRLRPDLQITGRTLLGAVPAKGQQLEDQYFGSIKDRVLNFMNDVERESYKLGIPVATRHNETAPNQYEFAPIYERSSISTDHNLLLMDILRKEAKKHGLACLLHEKPFAGVNGSGKHVNWSLSDEKGNNLLSHGDTPEENWQFLTFLTAVIGGVAKHSDVLRASIATAANEHRLGANEAPPSIMSIFLGRQLTDVVADIINGGNKKSPCGKKNTLNTGLTILPKLEQDQTDRNRTSPFAFTGSKFEFRACGSSENIAGPLMVINTIVADSLNNLADKIEKSLAEKGKIDEVLPKILREVLCESQNVLFEGNGYSQEWKEEAQKRGLSNVSGTSTALRALIGDETISLFERTGVLTAIELKSRYAIGLETYNKLLEIEANTIKELAKTIILPSAYEFQTKVGKSLKILSEIVENTDVPLPIAALDDRKELFADLSRNIHEVCKHLKQLKEMLVIVAGKDDEEKADYLYNDLKPHTEKIRKHIDRLELMMPDGMWGLPKYREMLFNL
jgi:glutamine synthetase